MKFENFKSSLSGASAPPGLSPGLQALWYDGKGDWNQAHNIAQDVHTLDGMVERQMKAAIKMIGDFWYTAWVDAGQPDLKSLINYEPSEEELLRRRQEVEAWKERTIKSRDHEQDVNEAELLR